MAAPRKVLSRQDEFTLNQRLKEVLVKLPDGLWSYPEGMSDQIIADEFKEMKNISVGTVQRCRQDVFGSLRKMGAKQDPRVEQLQQQLNEAQQLLLNLSACYESLRDKHDRLCQQLELNQVAKVKHLVVGGGRQNGVSLAAAAGQ